ncbi:TFIIH complex kinase subunit CCL1 [Sporobolomyces koalae]|uniref:TFIIH complex kinase subunit CCL1 n=1 Tax=Sporobolomyces koalae TaxID=500713 RepID=UPI00316DF055
MAVPASETRSTTRPIQLYHQSSQFRNWRYSKAGLDTLRRELNEQAVQRMKSLWEQERAQQEQAATSTDEVPTPPPGGSGAETEYLTVDDEQLLVTYYLTQVQAMCGAFQFPEMVQATAMSYLKRFYLNNKVMDYHPKNIMLTCVFLATKTENFPISIDAFSSRVKTAPVEILSLEFLVSQSLKFEYKVHHAHLGLNGILLDLQTCPGIEASVVASSASKATTYLKHSRHTWVELVYTPSQIALACLYLVSPDLVMTYLESKRSRSQASTTTSVEDSVMTRLLIEIGETIQDVQRHPIEKDKVKDIDKRLRWARNPEKDPNSLLYKKRKKEEEDEKEQKERDKAAKRPKPEDDGSVFD